MTKITNLFDFVKSIGEIHQEKTAYRFKKDNAIVDKTYRQLQNDSNNAGAYIFKTYGENNKMAILGETSYEWMVSYFGITTSHNVAVAIDKNLLQDEMCEMIKFAEVSVIFASLNYKEIADNLCKKCKNLKKAYIFEENFKNILDNNYTNNAVCKKEDLAQLFFTSGTTGVSKVVMLSHGNIMHAVYEHVNLLPEDSVLLNVLPIHHCFELISNNMTILQCGFTLCINDNMENLVQNMNIFKPTVLSIVPLIVKKISLVAMQVEKQLPEGILDGKNKEELRKIYASFHSTFGENLQTIIVGGAAIAKEIVMPLLNAGIEVISGYGLTESASCAYINKIKREDDNFGSIGKPYVNDMHAKICKGELCLKSPTIMMGYYKDEKATNEILKDGWLHTGDLVTMDERGCVQIVGRLKNLIILDNGKNIYPEELEGYLYDIDKINSSVVYEEHGKIAAIIQIDSENEEIKNYINDKIVKINNALPAYKKIMVINYTTKKFPLTTSKKVKRMEVIKNIDTYVKKEKLQFIKPQSKVQISVSEIIKDILKTNEDISINTNIFDLGMDSLAAVELGTMLDISIQDIYECLTIEKIAELVEKHDDTSLDDENEVIEDKINEKIMKNANIEIVNKGNTILLTGATGFLGSHILRELLEKKYKVVCLIRNKKKLESIYKYYFEEILPDNVVVVKGNIEEKMLGLDEEKYAGLANEINIVVHTAANVHHIGNYEEFEKTNVGGTKNIINFCLKANAVLHHASTYSVSGIGVVKQYAKEGIFDEFKLNIGQEYTQNVYVHSKYDAEKEVILARERGLVANIYRIGSLTWSKDGKFQINAGENGLIGRIKGIKKLKMYTDVISKYPMDFTAVDECAEAFTILLLHNKANNIYHLFNPNVLTIKNIENVYNCKCKKVSNTEFYEKIKKYEDKDVKVYSMYNQMASNSKSIPIDATFTNSILKEKDFAWRKIDKSYFQKYVEIQ